MLIPKSILASSILSPEAKSIHQNFAKKYSTVSKKHKPQISEEDYDNSLTEIPSIQLQKDIFNWFFSLDTSTRQKVSTIYNKWNTSILSQLLNVYFFKNKVTVKQTEKLNKELYDSSYCSSNYSTLNQHFYNNKDTECFTHFYRVYEQPISFEDDETNVISNLNPNISINDFNQQEKDFIQMVNFVSLTDKNDALCLSRSFLEQSNKVKNYFMLFSKNKVFTSWIALTQEEDLKMLNFTQQKWIKKNESFSIPQIVLSYYEHIIQLNYQHWYYTKKLYDFPYQAKLGEMLELNGKLEVFLKSEKLGTVLDSIDLDEISAKIKGDKAIRSEIGCQKKHQEMVYNIFFNSAAFMFQKNIQFEFVHEAFCYLRKESLKSVRSFIEMISFIEPKYLLNYNCYVFKEVYDCIHNYYVEKNLDELLASPSTKKETKGKKNAKKKKKKKEEIGEKTKDLHNKKQEENDKSLSMPIMTMKEKDSSVDDSSKIESIPSSITNVSTVKEEEDPEACMEVNKAEKENDVSVNKNKKKKSKSSKTELYLFPVKTNKKKTQSSKDTSKETKTQGLDRKPTVTPAVTIETKSNPIEVQSDSLSFINNSLLDTTQPFRPLKDNPQKQNPQLETSKDKEEPSPPFHLNSSITKQNHFYSPILNSYYQIPSYPAPIQPSVYPNYNMFYYHNTNLYQSNQINFKSLSNEIYGFNQTVTQNIALLAPYKNKYKLKIEEIIHHTLDAKYLFRIAYFGSYVSNLALENSDIDVLIIYRSKANEHIAIEAVIKELVTSFAKQKELFNYINPIYTASIPVIKLQCDYSKDIDKEVKLSLENDYLFDKSELCKVKFDLSFREEQDVTLISPSHCVLDYIKESLVHYPEIKPMISIIKRFMQKEQLNSSFKGGISSFALFLMVLSFFKLMNASKKSGAISIGQALMFFMEFYGLFNYSQYAIDSKRENPFVLNESEGECFNGITVLDPITGLNVAKTAFRVEEIKQVFVKGSEYIRQKTYDYNAFGNGSLLIGLFNH